jgi:hypothetical protein
LIINYNYKMGNSHTAASGSTLKKHIETATKTGVLQYDNKKLKEVKLILIKNTFYFYDYLLDTSWSLPSWFTYFIIE